MSNLWRIALARMTKQVDFFRTGLHSFILAGIATAVTAPYFYYLIFEVLSENPNRISGSYHMLTVQLILLFIVCLLSAVVGFGLGPRYQLPGFGDIRQYLHALPAITALGFVLMVASYVFFDRYFYRISPASYPSDPLFIVFMPLKGAFAEEVILRYGLITIAVGICKNRIAGVFVVAVFASVLSVKYLAFAGVGISLSYLFIAQIFYTFLINCILGILFVTRGLLYAMTVKFIIGMKYLLIAVSI